MDSAPYSCLGSGTEVGAGFQTPCSPAQEVGEGSRVGPGLEPGLAADRIPAPLGGPGQTIQVKDHVLINTCSGASRVYSK